MAQLNQFSTFEVHLLGDAVTDVGSWRQHRRRREQRLRTDLIKVADLLTKAIRQNRKLQL